MNFISFIIILLFLGFLYYLIYNIVSYFTDSINQKNYKKVHYPSHNEGRKCYGAPIICSGIYRPEESEKRGYGEEESGVKVTIRFPSSTPPETSPVADLIENLEAELDKAVQKSEEETKISQTREERMRNINNQPLG